MDFRAQSKHYGYVIPTELDTHVHVCSNCPQVGTTRFMTGQEWYDRFHKHLPFPTTPLGTSIGWNQADDAAKKASGIE